MKPPTKPLYNKGRQKIVLFTSERKRYPKFPTELEWKASRIRKQKKKQRNKRKATTEIDKHTVHGKRRGKKG